MARRRTSSRSSFWDILKFLMVIGAIALVVGYLYGTMALDYITSRENGLLTLFGYGSKDSPVSVDKPQMAQDEAGSHADITGPATEESTQRTTPDSKPAAGGTEVVVEALQVYRVQLGSFSVKDNANRLLDELQQAGYTALTTDGPPYRVWLGVGVDRQSLEALAAQLTNHDFEVFVGPLEASRLQADIPESVATVMQRARAVILEGADYWSQRVSGQGTALPAALAAIVDSAETAATAGDALDEVGDTSISKAAEHVVESIMAAVAALQRESTNAGLPPGDIELLQLYMSYQDLVQRLSN